MRPSEGRGLSDDPADAWDAGYRAAIEDYGCDIPWGGMTSDENPYRQTTTSASGDA